MKGGGTSRSLQRGCKKKKEQHEVSVAALPSQFYQREDLRQVIAKKAVGNKMIGLDISTGDRRKCFKLLERLLAVLAFNMKPSTIYLGVIWPHSCDHREAPVQLAVHLGQAVVHDENIEAEGRGSRGREHKLDKPGGEAEEMQGDKALGEVPTTALPFATNSASTKNNFGTMKRPNVTTKKGEEISRFFAAYLMGKYPEDAPYEETAPNAKVWRTYEDESKCHNTNMMGESRDNVDVIGHDYTRHLCFSSWSWFNVVIANGSSVDTITSFSLSPGMTFVPVTTDVWVNALWFTSLFLSPTTAFFAVIVKQRLHHHVVLPSVTPRDRAFTRQFQYGGFQKWHVKVIIGLLVVLMHLVLAIYLIGLAVFLHPLRATLSWIICTGTVLVYAGYVMASILPMFSHQYHCRTLLCDLIYLSFGRIIAQILWVKIHFLDAWRRGAILT
ncbi:hypothetical protein DFS33DRAFT_1270253 [Desarmillaria ectypa]|nr:hypothetical protein DFS33DRAFT_1270253 [Desarmillaria ectypa]